eukprot:6307586-Prymnesium_polylepis.1
MAAATRLRRFAPGVYRPGVPRNGVCSYEDGTGRLPIRPLNDTYPVPDAEAPTAEPRSARIPPYGAP